MEVNSQKQAEVSMPRKTICPAALEAAEALDIPLVRVCLLSESEEQQALEKMGSASCIYCQLPIYYCDCPEFVEDKHE